MGSDIKKIPKGNLCTETCRMKNQSFRATCGRKEDIKKERQSKKPYCGKLDTQISDQAQATHVVRSKSNVAWVRG